ncbi:hypothetical protein [Lichenicoccus sp.]|uniref:hypothetical protein n=1 Tax=Lichenicoccus sp. TaxID=2781899 RepID=UPI003D0D01ED
MARSISAAERRQQHGVWTLLLAATALLLHLGLQRPLAWTALAALAAVQVLCVATLRSPGGLAFLLALPACALMPRLGVVAALLVSHTALYGGLTLLFGRSLLPGREPLVTAMARIVEPELTPTMRVYTRRVTWLWTLYGPMQIAVSLLLLRFATLRAWSVFVNLIDLPLLASTFGLEFAARRWLLGGRSQATLRDTVRVAVLHWRGAS